MRKINKNQLNDWENPEIFEKNQVLPHTTLIPFSNQKQALNFDKTLSSFYFSLNGNWKFNWSPNIEEAPVDFYKKDYPYEDWEEIKVPSNWQMEGYGYPLFRNVGHSFPSDPPRVPAEFNPVGSYIKTFSLPQKWDDKKIFLHFEGVKSASYVWINGKKVGYNQGGMEPAEYDITQYLKPGENKIAVQVLRYSDGTYLECQDMWRLSGIYRDIYLMATPEVHLRDFYVTTDLDLDYKDAELKVKTRIKNYKKNKINNYKLIIELFNRDGKEVLSRPLEKNPGTLKAEREKEVVITETIKNPEKWSAESPYLYTICLKLQDETGEIVEILSHKVGFRKVEIKNQAIYVNGAPVKLNGVNSHMQHPETGRMLDKETMKKDLTLMKKFNINCVRTSHYPPNKEYLNLADKLGIYIIDEVGDEAHANEYLSDDPVWKEQYLDRMRKMVYRDRNHPSVIVWSAGNESGLGENICAIIEEGKKIDPSRPGWMYGGNKDNIPADNPIKCEDIVGPRYSRPFSLENHFGQIKKSEDSRPSFMDEYLSAAGNSLGGLDEYWDLIRKYPRLTGGAIWDWISPGLKKKVILTEDKSPYHHLCSLMGRSYLEKVESGKVLSLSGHDEWLEVYRSSALDIAENQLSISLWVYPETRNDSSLITKGNYQFGLEQKQNKLIFYLGGKSKIQIETELPIYWTDRWHHIAGIYDGEKISLYIDGELVVTQNWNQQLKNTPFPVTIGKNVQTQGQDYPGKLFCGLIDKVRLFEKVVTIENLYQDSNLSPEESLLWLDFETTETRGNFYTLGIGARSYGLVWPDRRVKPELWQVKKSAQPVSLEMDNLEKKRIKIINRHHFKNLKEFTGIWEVSKNGINGETIQTGELDLDLAPGEEKIIQIPFSQPKNGSEDYYLLISFRLSRGELWAREGHEIAWEQFKISSKSQSEFKNIDMTFSETGSSLSIKKNNNSQVKIIGDNFNYIFDKKSGFLKSMKYRGKQLIKAGPRFNVWRAPLANEIDLWPMHRTDIGYFQEEMGNNLASGWRSIGLDKLKHKLNNFNLSQNQNRISITTDYMVTGNNYESGFRVYYEYIISGKGEIKLNLKAEPEGCMTQWIPKIGTLIKLPEEFQKIRWYGKGPMENYPDRKTGAKIGIFESGVEKEYQPYLIPQDYGNKTEVKWISVNKDKDVGLLVTGKEKLNVSVHQFELENLSRANYPFQLENSDSTILNIDHKVTGVGGTSISVLDKYKVLPHSYQYSFIMAPENTN